MFYKLKNNLGRFLFDRSVRGVLRTRPIELDPESNLVVLSQLQHKDMLMYLVALKSFCRFVRPAKVVVVNDGTLDARDKETLAQHVPGIEIRELNEFASDACPSGGCWERLLAVAHYAQQAYTIQLDSDTLTLSEPTEVLECIDEDTSFALGTWDGQTIEPMRDCSARVRKKHGATKSNHVQLAAEAAFLDLPDSARMSYIRGCAGFAGFSKGSVALDFINKFSTDMQTLIGSKWNTWGSEQVMSNVIIANAPKATALPHPTYSDCLKMTKDNCFIHFIGDCRFANTTYRSLSRKIISTMTPHPK